MKSVDVLIGADRLCDYIPILSTVVNLVDLFKKIVIIPLFGGSCIAGNSYYEYLDKKSFSRCVILLIPFLGNVCIGILDFLNREWNNKEFVLAKVREDGINLQRASSRLRDDDDVVLAAVGQWGEALQYASERLRGSLAIVGAAVQAAGAAVLAYASPDVRENWEGDVD